MNFPWSFDATLNPFDRVENPSVPIRLLSPPTTPQTNVTPSPKYFHQGTRAGRYCGCVRARKFKKDTSHPWRGEKLCRKQGMLFATFSPIWQNSTAYKFRTSREKSEKNTLFVEIS
jgi:hypothetical protein